MRHIAFVWTSCSLLAGRKSVTRREWDAGYAAGFGAGDLVAAYDRQPRYRGERIGTIRLTATPAYEPMGQMPDGDYEGEGHAFYAQYPALAPKTIEGERVLPGHFCAERFRAWRSRSYGMWVVRFELAEIAAGSAVLRRLVAAGVAPALLPGGAAG